MKKLLWALSLVILCACGSKKKGAENATGETLEQRLDGFLKANQSLDFEKIMDYTYPKVFKFSSRDQVMRELKDGFSSEVLDISMDSLKVIRIHPVFTMDGGEYAKVEYSMLMLMDVKGDDDETTTPADTLDKTDHAINNDAYPAPQTTLMVTLLEGQYGKGNVSADPKTGIIKIRMISDMAAIKDDLSKDWSFINLKSDDPKLLNMLLSKELQEKFASYH
jgi:hypothetical protein